MTSPHTRLVVVREPGPDDAEARAVAEIARQRAELPPLDPAVFACHLGELALALEPTSEADPVGILACLICAAGVHLGPGPHVRAGDDRHPLLIWPLIVGRTGKGRKGAAWGSARRLLHATDHDFMNANQRSGLTSGEGLAAMFTNHTPPTTPTTDPAGGDATTATSGTGSGAAEPQAPADGRLPAGDRRLLVFEPEWGAVMARMKREGNSLSATLRAAWEGGNLSTLTVTARIAPTSHIGILAQITPDEFTARLRESDMAGGTYNRFLPLYVARSKFLPGGQGAPTELLDTLGARLADRLRQARQLRDLRFTPGGARLWRDLYLELGTDDGDNNRVEQFVSRAAPYCLRLAALHAALDNTTAIDTDHLAPAAALVRYSINTARAIFTNTPHLAALATWITQAGPGGRTRKEITTDYFRGHAKAADIQAQLDQLTQAGRITSTERARADGRPGRGTAVYTATDPANTANLRT